jgi:hypothetical protein
MSEEFQPIGKRAPNTAFILESKTSGMSERARMCFALYRILIRFKTSIDMLWSEKDRITIPSNCRHVHIFFLDGVD